MGAPFTPWAEERLKEIRPGNGPRAVTEEQIKSAQALATSELLQLRGMSEEWPIEEVLQKLAIIGAQVALGAIFPA